MTMDQQVIVVAPLGRGLHRAAERQHGFHVLAGGQHQAGLRRDRIVKPQGHAMMPVESFEGGIRPIGIQDRQDVRHATIAVLDQLFDAADGEKGDVREFHGEPYS